MSHETCEIAKDSLAVLRDEACAGGGDARAVVGQKYGFSVGDSQMANQQNKDSHSRTVCNIIDLPDDILLRVFPLTLPGVLADAVSGSLEKITSICSRFRQLIVFSPMFWITVSSDQHPELADLYLTRSKTSALTVFVSFTRDATRAMTFLTKIVRHCERLKSLSLHLKQVVTVELFEQIHGLLYALSLPILRDFNYVAPYGDAMMKYAHFYTSWVAPACLKFTGHNVVPKPIASTAMQLRHIFVDLGGEWNGQPGESGLELFTAFLRSQPTLEVLEVVISTDPHSASYYSQFQHRVVMQNLQNLFIHIWHGPTDTMFQAVTVLYALESPALKSLTLQLPVYTDALDMETLFPPYSDYSSLEYLHLIHQNLHPDGLLVPTILSFEHIFLRATNLKKLRLVTDLKVVFNSPQSSIAAPPLNTLELYNCPNVGQLEVLSIVQFLLRNTKQRSTLEALRVTKYPT